MNQEYTRRLEKIEAVLNRRLPEAPDASWVENNLIEFEGTVSFELIGTLTNPARDLLIRGGKRWRPLLMTLVCETLGGGDEALPLSPLVEFPHNASLIHDDIEDNSDERRGKPAVHLIYGTDTAINAGSFLYFHALPCLYEWQAPPERRERIYRTWGEYMRRLHLGQAMDIAWHRDFSSLPALAEYEQMCRLKTGVLARFAAVLGVLSAGKVLAGNIGEAEWERIEAEFSGKFGRAAENMGVGFQILDDVKNLTTGIPGKKRGDDIVEGKKSLPILLYLYENPERREFVARCFNAARQTGTGAEEVEELIAELERSGVLESAESQGLGLIKGAKEIFKGAVNSHAADSIIIKKEAHDLLIGLSGLIS